jgi:ABC-type polysaccharide/polyol phosphate export permease
MTGWFRWVADANPVSYLVEGMRDQIIESDPGRATLLGLAVAVAVAAVAIGFCHLAYRARLAGDA